MLPLIKGGDQVMQLMQTQWSAQINPLLAKPLSSSNILTGIKLSTGVNVINHLLDRQMQGWIISDIDSAITVYRSQPFNSKTLTLTSSGAGTVNLVVF